MATILLHNTGERESVTIQLERTMDIVLRIQRRLDSKWIKTDLQKLLNSDGLAQLWNEMVRDGEITGSFSDGLLNAAGITSRKGMEQRYEVFCYLLFFP